MIALERSYSFASSHLYRRPDWSEERNVRTFGKCANLPAHGHNYRLTILVAGEVDPETGFAADLVALDDLVRRLVVGRLDHRHINDAVPERFGAGKQIPTSECLVLWVVEQLVGELPPGVRLLEVRLAEDDRLGAAWRPDPTSRS